MYSNRLSRLRVRVLPVLAACVVCLGATSQSCKLGRDVKDQNDFSDFTVGLKLQDAAQVEKTTFDQEERIRFVLTVHNGKDKEVTLKFPTTLTADFAVLTDERNAQLKWVASTSTTPQNVETDVTFEAGGTQTFTFEAVLIDESTDDFLPRGDYQAVGALMLNFDNFKTDPLADNDLASNPLPFKID